ncbi:MAG TPA: KUP/HAK/KT family potassium transporter [Polyangia bacterium]
MAEAKTEPAGTPGRIWGVGRLGLAALGIVFGDIGTSPLYTLRACLTARNAPALGAADLLGVLSLIFWTLTLVVSLKYVTVIMRADNRGEGGIFALLALLPERSRAAKGGVVGIVALLVIAGAALLYGDGMITPAISVLSAVEGLEVAAPWLKPAVLPITCLVLVGLFAFQHRGTSRIGRVFGPIMALWFIVIGALGLVQIANHPAVLAALGPQYAVHFFVRHGLRSLVVLGSVVLAVTGAEALYADMGHFGAAPIRAGWFALVMPALVLNYLGQGALILTNAAAAQNPFFALAPSGAATYALIGLSTAATVIASQALISGAFSLTHQAMQLGFLPPVTVVHTSGEEEGQVYVPAVNRLLAVACVGLVLIFRHSSRLASAYGVAVTGTMVLTSIIFFEVARTTWRWPLWKASSLLILFLAVDLAFFVSNLLKVVDGGFLPLAVGLVLFVAMATWKRGRRIFRDQIEDESPPLADFLSACRQSGFARTPGAGIFVTGHPAGVPPVLRALVARVGVLPETVVLLTMQVRHVPRITPEEGVHYDRLDDGFHRLVVQRGYLDQPDVPAALARACRTWSIPIDSEKATFFLGRATFIASSAGRMGHWSESLFAFMARNSRSMTDAFCIPPARVVEIGVRLDL